MSRSLSCFLLLIGFCQFVFGETNSSSTAATQDLKTAASSQAITYTTPMFWPELWRNSLSQVLSVGGVILSGILIFGGILWVLGVNRGGSFRFCNLFGNCEKQSINYNSGGNLDPDSYPYHSGPYNGGGYIQKRSINFVAPILKKLATTFETMKQNEQSPFSKKQ